MNFKIVLNIQWLFFILFYGWCSGEVGGGERGTGSSGNDYSGYNKEFPDAEVTRNGRSVRNRTDFKYSSVVEKLDQRLSWNAVNQSKWGEEHERFEVARKNYTIAPKNEVKRFGVSKKRTVDDYDFGGLGTEIDDSKGTGVNDKDDRDLVENTKKKKNKSMRGRLARKLLSIEADPAGVDDRDDTVAAAAAEASDYGLDKEALSSAALNGDDDLVLSGPRRRRMSRRGSRPNRANQDRRRVVSGQEMDDSRKSGREAALTEQETIPDKSTFYRQRYPPVDEDGDDDDGEKEGQQEEGEGVPGDPVESTTTECDCVAKCATERGVPETSTEPESSDTGDNNEVTTEEIESEDQEEEEEEEEVVDEQEEPAEDKELTAEETPSDGTSKQREVYIDLKIGIKSVGNGSLSEDSEPLEFHRKILVKRAKIGDDFSLQLGELRQQQQQQQQKPSSVTHFPISLVKAIYQLVDSNDSLRTHVAPRLPSRTKVLSRLETAAADRMPARQKINDGGPQHQLAGRGGSKKEQDHKAVDKVVAVIDALKELIQQ